MKKIFDKKMKGVFDKKTTGFLFLGIILFFGSTNFNILKENSADMGFYLSIIIISISIVAQVINWIIYWKEKLNL